MIPRIEAITPAIINKLRSVPPMLMNLLTYGQRKLAPLVLIIKIVVASLPYFLGTNDSPLEKMNGINRPKLKPTVKAPMNQANAEPAVLIMKTPTASMAIAMTKVAFLAIDSIKP